MEFSAKFSLALQTKILSTETLDFIKQIIFLRLSDSLLLTTKARFLFSFRFVSLTVSVMEHALFSLVGCKGFVLL